MRSRVPTVTASRPGSPCPCATRAANARTSCTMLSASSGTGLSSTTSRTPSRHCSVTLAGLDTESSTSVPNSPWMLLGTVLVVIFDHEQVTTIPG